METAVTFLQATSDSQEKITASYRIQADKLDLRAVNSYPQQIAQATSANEPKYDLEIHLAINPGRLASLPLAAYDYPEDVRPYLEPSAKIESDSPLIAALAAEIIGAETDIAAIAARSVAGRLKISLSLAGVLPVWRRQDSRRGAQGERRRNCLWARILRIWASKWAV
jgi:hypothetical protein